MKIVQIDGGAGRCLCATRALENLYATTGEKITVITAWPEVFLNAPYIHKLYNLTQVPYLFDDIIKHGEFVNPEPYHNFHYYNQRHNLAQSFDFLINDEVSVSPKPTVYLNRDEKAFGADIVNQAKQASGKKIVVALQGFGAGARMLENGELVDESNRSLNKKTVDLIINSQECVFVNLSHIPMHHPNVWMQPDLNIRKIMAITSACDFVVSIDSLLSHIACALDKPTILLLGSTFKENVGYDHFRIVQRQGYPKSYFPNRFHGFVDQNQGAMDFTEEEDAKILQHIKDLCNG